MKRIAAKATISGVQSEGEVLLHATKDKEESEIGDNNDFKKTLCFFNKTF